MDVWSIPSLSVAVAEYAMVSQYAYVPLGLVSQAPASQVLVAGQSLVT
jgi:hypothetical protein